MALSKSATAGWGVPSLPFVTVSHPLSGLTRERARHHVDGSLELIVSGLTEGAELLNQDSSATTTESVERKRQLAIRLEQTVEKVEIADSFGAFREVNDLFYRRGWTDGFPIVPPVEPEVERFLDAWGRDPNHLVTVVPPQSGLATIQKIAINMVMAGCEPEYLPVIETALLAMSDERFCWINSITGTGMQSRLIIVNGPIRKEIGLNSGINMMGPGWRANATIGRAIRLILTNIGGCIPILYERSTQGHPGKYTYVVVENEEASPWPPLHTEYGLDRDESAVTVVTGQPPVLIKDTASSTGLGILHTICSAMAIPDSANYSQFGDQVLLIAPEHAATLAASGFDKLEIRRYIMENARIPITKFAPGFIEIQGRFRWGKRYDVDNPTTLIPVVEKIDDIIVVVAGGAGKHSSFIPTYAQSRRVTRKISP